MTPVEIALSDLHRIAAWLAEDIDNDEAQGAASDLLAIARWIENVAGCRTDREDEPGAPGNDEPTTNRDR